MKKSGLFLWVAAFSALVWAGCAKSYDANAYVYSQFDKLPIDSARVDVFLGDSNQIYETVYTDTAGYFSVHIGDLGCIAGDCPEFWMVITAPAHQPKKVFKAEGEKIYLDFF